MCISEGQREPRTEELRVPSVQFLAEQDGKPERELKDRLTEVFQDCEQVLRAYLARVTYGSSAEVNVSLCLRITGNPDPSMLRRVASIFHATFNVREHLDTIVLDEEKELGLSAVCPPFFAREQLQKRWWEFWKK
jgi:hypothetical protein